MNAEPSCPTVTVLLPVFNADRYISKSIDSILCQSWESFELLILDDGSTDNTRDIIRSYQDERIRLVVCEHNYIQTLNTGIDLSKGKYIARMDADDIMYPDRLRVQVSLLEEEPEIALCSTWMRMFDMAKGVSRIGQSLAGVIENPILPLLESNFIAHPTVMIRKEFLCKNSLYYSTDYPYAEDYKLWVDMALAGAVFYIEPEPLLHYRVHNEQVSQKNLKTQRESSIRVQKEIISHLLLTEPYSSLSKIYAEIVELERQGFISSHDSPKFISPFIHKLSHATLTQ